jgi:hypothetical protein
MESVPDPIAESAGLPYQESRGRLMERLAVHQQLGVDLRAPGRDVAALRCRGVPVEQHLGQLEDRLLRLGFITGKDTGGRARVETESPAHTEVEAGDDLPESARRDSNARPLAPERRPGHQPPPEGAKS